MARLRSDEPSSSETPQGKKNRLTKLIDSTRKSLSPNSSGSSVISTSSGYKLRKGFSKVGLFPHERSPSSSSSENILDIRRSPPPSPDTQQMEQGVDDTLQTLQPVELPADAVTGGVDEGFDEGNTTIYLGDSKPKSDNHGHAELPASRDGDFREPLVVKKRDESSISLASDANDEGVNMPLHQDQSEDVGGHIDANIGSGQELHVRPEPAKESNSHDDDNDVDTSTTSDDSEPEVNYITINGTKYEAYTSPQLGRQITCGARGANHAPGSCRFCLALERMHFTSPVNIVMKLGPVTFRNGHAAYYVYRGVLSVYGVLIVYAALYGPAALLLCFWYLFLYFTYYEWVTMVLEWEEPGRPDVLLFSLRMIAREIPRLTFDIEDDLIVGVLGYRWGRN